MKPAKLLSICFFLSLSFLSCDKNSSDSGVIVESIEASINFDLSARSNWLFYVHDKRYEFTNVNGTLSAIPYNSEKPYVFPSSTESGNIRILLYSPNYGRTREAAKVPPSLENQSTLERFTNCDILKGEYQGTAQPHLTNITLYHENALLDFQTINIPSNAQVYIRQIHDQTITPLRDTTDPTQYKAIIFPHNHLFQIIVGVKTENKTYETPLAPLSRKEISYPDGVGNSAIIVFTAAINAEDELVIENLQREAFSKKWPIKQ